jgi:Leucine-rich repeat (LRR) protein
MWSYACHLNRVLYNERISISRIAAALLLLATMVAGGAPAPAAEPSADRIVAERVLRLGGSVVLEGQDRPVTDLEQLPTSDFRIRTLNLVGVTLGAFGLQHELARLPALPHLKELYLNGRLWYGQRPNVVADTLAAFAGARGVDKVVLSKPVQTYIPMRDDVLASLKTLNEVEQLRLHQTRIEGESLAPFRNLRFLDVSHNRFFDDRGLQHVGRMTRLSKLYLRGTSITDEGLRNLAGLTDLTELDLYGTGISDAGLAHLKGLSKLRRLNLLGSNVTDAGLEALRGMTELEQLSLYRTRVSNAGLARLWHMERLNDLDVRYSRVTSAGVDELLKRLPRARVQFQQSAEPHLERTVDVSSIQGKGDAAIAEWLRSIGAEVRLRDGNVVGVSLASTSITDAEVAVLKEFPQLEELSLRNTQVSNLGATHLAIPSLQVLDVGHTLLSDPALAFLGKNENLRKLDMAHTLVEGPGLAALANLAHLEELNLASSALTDEGLEHIGKTSGLQRLSLDYTDVSDRGLSHLAGLGRLTHLDLTGADVSDEGLAHLSGLVGLVELHLGFGRFTDKGIALLAGLTRLKKLSLPQTSTTDAAMDTVAKFAELEALDLDHTVVSDAGLQKLRGLGHLVELRLDSANVTDDGVEHLAALARLQELDLYHTLVGETAFQQLREALPQCTIHYDLDSGRSNRRGN